MTISTMNTQSGTNGILPDRITCGITLDLQKQRTWIKKQQKEHLFRFDMILNTYTVGTNFILKNIFSDCTIFWYRR